MCMLEDDQDAGSTPATSTKFKIKKSPDPLVISGRYKCFLDAGVALC